MHRLVADMLLRDAAPPMRGWTLPSFDRQKPEREHSDRGDRRAIGLKDRCGQTFARHAAILMAFFCHCYRNTGTTMARDVNPLKSEQITLSVNAQTVWYLDRLVETGLYGNNRTEAARVAIYDHCKFLISQGSLEIAPRLAGHDVAVLR